MTVCQAATAADAVTVDSSVVKEIPDLRDVMAWAHSHQGRKLIRYSMVSVISTGVSFSAIWILYGSHFVKGVIWATLIGNVIAAVPSYYLNRSWAWGRHGRSHFAKEVVPFWTMSFLGIAFSMIGAAFAKDIVKDHDWSHLTNTALVSFTNVLSFGVFWILKIIVFNRIFHDHTLEEIDEELREEEAIR